MFKLFQKEEAKVVLGWQVENRKQRGYQDKEDILAISESRG
jgi:hypothetical protein